MAGSIPSSNSHRICNAIYENGRGSLNSLRVWSIKLAQWSKVFVFHFKEKTNKQARFVLCSRNQPSSMSNNLLFLKRKFGSSSIKRRQVIAVIVARLMAKELNLSGTSKAEFREFHCSKP